MRCCRRFLAVSAASVHSSSSLGVVSSPLQSHLTLSKALWRATVEPSDTVVDATCGRGYDTLELVKLTPLGHVFAMDTNPRAISVAKARVAEWLQSDLSPRCTFVERSHATPPDGLDRPKLVVFNLGYFPGTEDGERRMLENITEAESTIAALESWALPRLASAGFVSLAIYPGHEQGKREARALDAFAGALSPTFWRAASHRILNHDRNRAPYLMTLHRQPKRKSSALQDDIDIRANLKDAKTIAINAITSSSRDYSPLNEEEEEEKLVNKELPS